ncbi:hypothetical protein DL96DRAFT_1712824 [Flagelloscypha sp. PMI_526]|nr:hypothetical protein DL96DRAFT_1712824 [Flagelloscypha sp. PMI_526]
MHFERSSFEVLDGRSQFVTHHNYLPPFIRAKPDTRPSLACIMSNNKVTPTELQTLIRSSTHQLTTDERLCILRLSEDVKSQLSMCLGALSRLRDLPNETLALIFHIHVDAILADKENQKIKRILILAWICARFRLVAFGTPELWIILPKLSFIGSEVEDRLDLSDHRLTTAWMKRALPYSTHLKLMAIRSPHLERRSPTVPALWCPIVDQAELIGHLNVTTQTCLLEPITDSSHVPPFPRLKKLTINVATTLSTPSGKGKIFPNLAAFHYFFIALDAPLLEEVNLASYGTYLPTTFRGLTTLRLKILCGGPGRYPIDIFGVLANLLELSILSLTLDNLFLIPCDKNILLSHLSDFELDLGFSVGGKTRDVVDSLTFPFLSQFSLRPSRNEESDITDTNEDLLEALLTFKERSQFSLRRFYITDLQDFPAQDMWQFLTDQSQLESLSLRDWIHGAEILSFLLTTSLKVDPSGKTSEVLPFPSLQTFSLTLTSDHAIYDVPIWLSDFEIATRIISFVHSRWWTDEVPSTCKELKRWQRVEIAISECYRWRLEDIFKRGLNDEDPRLHIFGAMHDSGIMLKKGFSNLEGLATAWDYRELEFDPF